MSGFFGVSSKTDCVLDLFFGVDYHSHLGTKRGGMVVCGENGFQRSIHNIENSPFRSKFEKDIESDSRWVEELGTKIEQILPISIEVKIQGFDRFLFYNITTAEYNVYPTDGEHDCLLVAYDYDLQRIVILDDWTIVQT